MYWGTMLRNFEQSKKDETFMIFYLNDGNIFSGIVGDFDSDNVILNCSSLLDKSSLKNITINNNTMNIPLNIISYCGTWSRNNIF